MIFRDASPYAPIPGTTPQPRGLFLDSWGTLLVRPKRGYAKTAEELEFVPGAIDALFRARQAGWKLYLVGNQDAVARGKVSDEQWARIEETLLTTLAQAGAGIERSYLCLDHPTEGVRGHQSDSVYLLPNTGAFYHAAHTDGIELRRSWVVGDSTLELVAGWRAGLRLAGLRSGQGLADATFEVSPELEAEDLTRAVLELLTLEDALHP